MTKAKKKCYHFKKPHLPGNVKRSKNAGKNSSNPHSSSSKAGASSPSAKVTHKIRKHHRFASMPPVERVVLLNGAREETSSLFPQGWGTVSHRSGENIYFHRATGVCTLAWPYKLKSHETEVNHAIPSHAHPGYARGLHYWRDFEASFHFLYDKMRPPSPSNLEAYLAEIYDVDNLRRSRQEEDEKLGIESELSSLNLNADEEDLHVIKLRTSSYLSISDQDDGQGSNEDSEDILLPEDTLQPDENPRLPSNEKFDYSGYFTDDKEDHRTRLIISVSDPDTFTETQGFLHFNLKYEEEPVSVVKISPEETVKPKRTKELEECIHSLREKELWKPLTDQELGEIFDQGIGNLHEGNPPLYNWPDGGVLILQITSTPGDESEKDTSFTEDIVNLVKDEEEEYYPAEAQVLEDLAGTESGGEGAAEGEKITGAEMNEPGHEQNITSTPGDESEKDTSFTEDIVNLVKDEEEEYYPAEAHVLEDLAGTESGGEGAAEGEKITGAEMNEPGHEQNEWDIEEETVIEIDAMLNLRLDVDGVLRNFLKVEREMENVLQMKEFDRGFRDEAAEEQRRTLLNFLVDSFCQTKNDINVVLYLNQIRKPRTYLMKVWLAELIGKRLFSMENRIKQIATGYRMLLETQCRNTIFRTNPIITDLDEEQEEDMPVLVKLSDYPHWSHLEACSPQVTEVDPIPSTSKSNDMPVQLKMLDYPHWSHVEARSPQVTVLDPIPSTSKSNDMPVQLKMPNWSHIQEHSWPPQATVVDPIPSTSKSNDKPVRLKLKDCPHWSHIDECSWSRQGTAVDRIPSTSKSNVSRVCQSFEHWEGCVKQDEANEGTSQGRRPTFAEWIQKLKSNAVPMDLVKKCPFFKQWMADKAKRLALQEKVGRSQGCGRENTLSAEEMRRATQRIRHTIMKMCRLYPDLLNECPFFKQWMADEAERLLLQEGVGRSQCCGRVYALTAEEVTRASQSIRRTIMKMCHQYSADLCKIKDSNPEECTCPSEEAVHERLRAPPEEKTPKKDETGKGKKNRKVWNKRK